MSLLVRARNVNAAGIGSETDVPIDVPGLSALRLTDRFDPSLPPYLGNVATRCRILDHNNTSNKQLMFQSYHFLRDDVTAIRILLPGWIVTGNAETNIGGPINYTATISTDPTFATFSRFTWGKANSGACGAGGTLLSDAVPFVAANGTKVYCRVWSDSPNGGILTSSQLQDAANGDFCIFGATTPDLTGGGAIVSTDSSTMSLPLGLIAVTSKPSVIFYADSRGAGIAGGSATSGADWSRYGLDGNTGSLERALGAFVGYINCGESGDKLTDFLGSCTKRIALAQFGTSAIVQLGANDLNAGRTAAQIKDDMSSIRGLLPAGMKVYTVTVEPDHVTSSDNFATAGNQTVGSDNAARIAENTRRKAGIPGYAGCFDIASILEDGANAGKWITSGLRVVTDGGFAATNTAFVSASAAFTQADVGKALVVPGAGAAAATLHTVIKVVNSATSITTWDAASTIVSAQTCVIGGATADGTHATYTSDLAVQVSQVVSAGALAR